MSEHTKPSEAAMRQIRRQCLFRYIDIFDAQLLEFVHVGRVGWVAVIGHPEDGTYEWVHQPVVVADLTHD